MNECKMTSDEDKKRLLADYRARKAAKNDGKIKKLSNQDEKNDEINSSLFTAKFCDGAVECSILADQGSDASVLPPHIFERMILADPNLEAVELKRVRTYDTVDSNATPLSSSRRVIASVLLNIRHGTHLCLRRMEWMISDQQIEHAIISRHVLSALGLDNRLLLAAASDRFNGEVDVPDLISNSSENPRTKAGTIQSLLKNRDFGFGSTFHSQGEGKDDLDHSEIYIDLGEDVPEDLTNALTERVKDARKNGMSESGCKQLGNLLDKYKAVFE